ncbi:MAG: hypothetical protein JKP92_04110 [Alphaproteobacteria bacterium]|jgi:hypothetical protein|nr:hypothetical protein [Alphaproteobacteria bacterium]
MAESPSAADLLTFCRSVAAPLVAAAAGEDGAEKAAQATAALLARTATAGVDIGRLLGGDAEKDGGRLALAALAAPLVAGLYEKGAHTVPDEAAMAKVVESMRAVAAFAQGFGDIQVSTPEGPVATLAALAPVVGAVAADPLGAEPEALVKDLAEKLRAQAEALSAALGAGDEAALLPALAPLYVACHREAKDPEGAWAAFAERAAMLEVLAKSMAAPPVKTGGDKAPPALAKEDKTEGAPAPPPIRRSPAAPGGPGVEAPKTDAPAEAAKERTKGPPGGNPMAFFKKKKKEEGEEE